MSQTSRDKEGLSTKFLSALATTLVLGVGGCAETRPIVEPPAGLLDVKTGDVLVLSGARVLDGNGGDPIFPGTLIIEGERIKAIGPTGGIEVPSGAKVIDLSGKTTLLPGFINAHVHLTSTIGKGPRSRWVEEGITTVCDLGAPGEQIGPLKRSSSDKDPRVIAAGPLVSVPNGYPGYYWGPSVHLSVQGEEDARRRVDALIDNGADVIKISLERFGSKNLPILSPTEIRAITDAAHARGIRVLAHVDVSANLEIAVAGGVDAAAHIVRDSLPDFLIQKMVGRNFYIIPTLAVIDYYTSTQYSRNLWLLQDDVRRFVAAGGKVAFGDDWGNPGTSTGMPWYELDLLRGSGLSPAQIVVSATKHSAYVCNRDKELGTLAPGKLADLLVVDGDPLEDLRALKRVLLVLKSGRAVGGPWVGRRS
jgi:enamidase